MKKDGEDKILDEIIASLKNHNEGYIEGSWERFQKKRAKKKNRKTIIAIFTGGIAAMFFLCISVYISNNYEAKQDRKIIPQANNFKNKTEKAEKTITISCDSMILCEREKIRIKRIPPHCIQLTNEKENIELAKCTKAIPEEFSLNEEEKETTDGNNNKSYSNITQNAGINNASRRIGYTPPNNNNRDKKFSWGVMVRKTVNTMSSSSKMPFAFGFVNEMKLNDKLSCNTGVVIDKYNLDNGQDGMFTEPGEGSTSEDTDLMYLDIPLNLNMKLVKMKQSDIIISGGVSSLVFFNSQSNRFAESENTSGNIKKINLAGQLNVSGGYLYHISPKMNLTVEAYMKLPLYKLATENDNFYQSGISLKISR